jgi:cytochrome d ubiquinol oxidase subunit I
MGLIGTRSVSKQIPGIHEIMAQNRLRIQSGMLAVQALETLRRDRLDSAANKVLEAHKQDLGFGLLLKKYTADVATATPQMIDAAARDTIPRVAPMFWSFRLMVGMGMAMLLLFGWSFWASLKGDFQHRPRLLKLALWCLPLPWLSCELGWVVGIRPSAVDHLRRAAHPAVGVHLVGGVAVRFAGRFCRFLHRALGGGDDADGALCPSGPGSLGTGRYDHETAH